MKRQRRNCDAVDGVLLLDKPAGMTSNAALQTAKRLLNACKAGHTGSLDPIATGLLPIAFGEATKLSRFLFDADKRYRAVFRLGQTTTTYDCEGEVTATRAVTVGRAEIERVLARFTGELDQVPPMYSAVKREGRALYRLARAGIEVERPPRRVVVRELRLLAFDGDDARDGGGRATQGAVAERLTVEVACSKGTYVRTLAHDVGEALGCGAHVAALRRLAVGPLEIEQAVTLDALEAIAPPARAGRLRAGDDLLVGLPTVRLTPLAAYYLRQGQAVSARHGLAPGWVRLYEGERRFLGLGEVLDDGRVAPRRLVTAAASEPAS